VSRGPSRITVEEFREILKDGMPSAVALGFDVISMTRGEVVLRSTKAGALVTRATLLKVGERLVVGDVVIASERDEDDGPVMHGVMTYAVPG
jgi:hypothetical protein